MRSVCRQKRWPSAAAALAGVVYRQFWIRDNGEPVEGVAVDELQEIGTPTSAPQPCADPNFVQSGGFILQEGNIVVRDA